MRQRTPHLEELRQWPQYLASTDHAACLLLQILHIIQAPWYGKPSLPQHLEQLAQVVPVYMHRCHQ
jgi:hypothetical protein